jgi:hypothetical protein
MFKTHAQIEADRDASRKRRAKERASTPAGQRGMTAAEIRKWRAENLPKDRQQIQKAEGDARRAADMAEAPEIDPRSRPLAMQNAPPPVVIAPPGENRDHWLHQQREAEIVERMDIEPIGAVTELEPAVQRTFSLLLAHARPTGRKGTRWWPVSVSEVGSKIELILDEPPEALPAAVWLATTQQRLPSPEQRIRAARLLEQHLDILEAVGAWRWTVKPAQGEISIAG